MNLGPAWMLVDEADDIPGTLRRGLQGVVILIIGRLLDLDSEVRCSRNPFAVAAFDLVTAAVT